MSGHGYSSWCPKCDEEMNSYSDHKPYDLCSHECYNCGFVVYPKEERSTLEELNDMRLDMDMKKLTKKEYHKWDKKFKT